MSEIIIQTGIYRPVLKKIINDFKSSNLSFADINELSDKDLEELFQKPKEGVPNKKLETLYNLFPEIDKELKRKGVTKALLWEEYKRKYPDGASSTAFHFHFSQWKARMKLFNNYKLWWLSKHSKKFLKKLLYSAIIYKRLCLYTKESTKRSTKIVL